MPEHDDADAVRAWQVEHWLFMSDADEGTEVPAETESWIASSDAVEVEA